MGVRSGTASPCDRPRERTGPGAASAGEARSEGVPKRSDPQAREQSGPVPTDREHRCTNERPRTRWPGAHRCASAVLRGDATGSDAAAREHRTGTPSARDGADVSGARAIQPIPEARATARRRATDRSAAEGVCPCRSRERQSTAPSVTARLVSLWAERRQPGRKGWNGTKRPLSERTNHCKARGFPIFPT